MRKKRQFRQLLWIPALCFLTACGNGQGKNEVVTETEMPAAERLEISTDQALEKNPETTKDIEPPSPKKTVRIFLPDKNTLRFRMDGEYLEEQFENAGFEAVTYYAGLDAEKQAAALRNVSDLPTDLFVLVPLEGREVREAVKEIGEGEIPLIVYDQPLSNMGTAAFFVGFRDEDVTKALEEVQNLEEAHLLELTEAEETETETVEMQEEQEEEQTEEEEDPVDPLLGEDEDTDYRLLAELKDGERQAVVYRDTAGEAVAVLDIGINLLRGVTPDAGLIAASGWEFPCTYREGTDGVRPAEYDLQPVLLTTDNMEELLVVPGYYDRDTNGYLRPGTAE